MHGTVPANDRFDELVAQYIQVREIIASIKKRHETELEEPTTIHNILTGKIQELLDSTGQDSARTKHGTCYNSTRFTASLSDPDEFMKFVIANQLWELIDRRANGTAVKEYVQENNGAMPPGVTLNAMRTIGVRKPTRGQNPD